MGDKAIQIISIALVFLISYCLVMSIKQRDADSEPDLFPELYSIEEPTEESLKWLDEYVEKPLE